MIDTNTKSISLNNLGIKNATIRYQLTSSELHEETLKKEQGVASSLGAIASKYRRIYRTSPNGSIYCERLLQKMKFGGVLLIYRLIQKNLMRCIIRLLGIYLKKKFLLEIVMLVQTKITN